MSANGRFRDSKTNAADHPWRIGTTVDGTSAQWDLKWHHLHIPLSSFIEKGAWDNGTWFVSEEKFDWTKVDLLEISTEWTDILGKRVWFDNIHITDLDTAFVRVNEAVGINDVHGYGTVVLTSSPNPMREHSVIMFNSSDESHIQLTIFSATGARIKTLADKSFGPGPVSIVWDGSSDNGSVVAPGIYICRLLSKSASGFCRIVKY